MLDTACAAVALARSYTDDVEFSAEDATWTFQVPAGTFTDADNPTLSYTATLADGTSLPTWLGFNAGTQTFVGTPPQDFNGALQLKVTASDGLLKWITTV